MMMEQYNDRQVEQLMWFSLGLFKHLVRVKHLIPATAEYITLQKAMNDVADVLDGEPCFHMFDTRPFRNIPKEDEFMFANNLLNKMFDYADEKGILVE